MSIKSDISTDLIRVDMIVSRRQEQTIELVTIVAKKKISLIKVILYFISK